MFFIFKIKKNNNIYKRRNKLLVFNIVSDAISALMIPFIPIGFINMKKWYMLTLAIIGIICAIYLVYITVFLWLRFSYLNRRCKIHKLIMENGIYEVSEISRILNLKPEQVDYDILFLIRCGYLVGFNYDGRRLSRKEEIKPDTSNLRIIKACPNCGASDTQRLDDGSFFCPYCSSKF